jgi:hypothetical protein
MDNILTSRIEQHAGHLRRVVACDDFAAAEACAAAYGELVSSELEHLQPAEAARRLSGTMALLESSRRTICAARAGLLAHMRELQRTIIYQAAAPAAEAVHTWRLEG